jgi:hypothetical protein
VPKLAVTQWRVPTLAVSNPEARSKHRNSAASFGSVLAFNPAMTSKHVVFASLILVHATTAMSCKKKSEPANPPAEKAATTPTATPDPVPAPLAPTPAPVAIAGFDLSFVVAATSEQVSAPGLNLEFKDVATLVEERAKFAESQDNGKIATIDKLADGEVWHSSGSKELTAYRKVGGRNVLCTMNDDENIETGLASCKAIVTSASGLLVPFQLPKGDDTVHIINIDDISLMIERAASDAAKNVDEETANAKNGLKILQQAKLDGGYAVAYQTFNGGIESQGLIYRAQARGKVGAADVVCSGSTSSKTPEKIIESLNACVKVLSK